MREEAQSSITVRGSGARGGGRRLVGGGETGQEDCVWRIEKIHYSGWLKSLRCKMKDS